VAVDDAQLLTDIRLELRHHELRPVYVVATGRQRQRGGQGSVEVDDFDLIGGRDNLGQAVIIRLLTPRGELAPLAHPEYGSRLHELIGRPNDATGRNLLKLYILESLQAEPRIAKVLDVSVTPTPGTRDRVDVSIQVQPIGKTNAVTVGPFTLEL
jgi:phage baseplate assembly protein W